MATHRAVIVGAGMGGLAAAIDLARAGVDVSVFERASGPGGKIRQTFQNGVGIDAGPTVVTMKWVFDDLFSAAGQSLSSALTLVPLDILARHAFDDGSVLDLHAEQAKSADAIGRFAGAQAAQGFLEFAKRARETYRTLEAPFIRAEQPSPVSLALGAGLRGLGDLWKISPFTTLWRALGDHFEDPRLRQLFGRYATYCGSSPFDCPATLMLVADVEQQGVWIIDGGMLRLAEACQALAQSLGVRFHFGREVTKVESIAGRASAVVLADGDRVDADAVILNADPSALAGGLFGSAVADSIAPIAPGTRSLSAITFAVHARADGFPLSHHNVFFSSDYKREFDDILRFSRTPSDPTVYICAQDRGPSKPTPQAVQERLFMLINAPASGDVQTFSPRDVEQCRMNMTRRLERCGLTIEGIDDAIVATPRDFHNLFPATGGALYGQASHGWTASFTRPAARTRCPRLYLAGGAVHPGPGVPMAALSGRIAARAVLADLTSPRR